MMLKNILNIAGWVVLGCGVIMSVGFVNMKKESLLCKGVEINIDRGLDHFFLEENDIRTMLEEKQAHLQGKPIADINISMLEKWVRINPFVENAEVYSGIDGTVHIDVKQRNPILRVIGGFDSYYIDGKGAFMPLSEKYSARVPVATGFIYEPYVYREAKIIERNPDTSDVYRSIEPQYRYTLKDSLFTLAAFLNSSEFWKAQVQQIYVNEGHEFELVPTVGYHNIILGDLSDMEEKFDKLLKFYQMGLSKTGWNKYSVVNLKFKNQVVCNRR